MLPHITDKVISCPIFKNTKQRKLTSFFFFFWFYLLDKRDCYDSEPARDLKHVCLWIKCSINERHLFWGMMSHRINATWKHSGGATGREVAWCDLKKDRERKKRSAASHLMRSENPVEGFLTLRPKGINLWLWPSWIQSACNVSIAKKENPLNSRGFCHMWRVR